jgi:2-methylisocitrate lyase-like PEP mutase family enzyme
MRSSLSYQSACSLGLSKPALRQSQGACENVVVRIRMGRRGEMAEPTEAVSNAFGTLQSRCDLFRSLHVPSRPLLLPNAWDAATARAVVMAGFPVVATTSAGITAALGYQDRERAPREEMLLAAGRIVRSVDVPVTVDLEAGYGLEPAELVAALLRIGAAGCNLEDTDHSSESLRDSDQQADWLRRVREAANDQDYGLVINARIDVFLHSLDKQPQADLLEEALQRARAYLEAGADCVYPITLWERDVLASFVADVGGSPVNILATPRAPGIADLAELGVARISWAGSLYRGAMEWLAGKVASLAEEASQSGLPLRSLS